jgi:hypothetical protein
VKGGVTGGVVGGVVGAPLPKNTGPKMLLPQIGRGLLLTNTQDEQYKVKVPTALTRTGMRFSATMRICVTAQGTVYDVHIIKGADPAIDPQIPGVVRRWRYRPYTENGVPKPFCYNVRYDIE